MRIPQHVIGLNVKDIIHDVANYLNKVSKGYLRILCWVLMHKFVGRRFMSCFRRGEDFCLPIGLDVVVIGVMDVKCFFDLTFIGSYLEA